jgi:phosphatidylglycerol:prolipoprotein diacylglycerol transferase
VWEGHPLAIIYPQASLAAPAGVPLLAVPVIEAAFLAALAAVCLTALARTKKDGISAVMYLLLYPVIRFTIEFFRGDAARGAVGLLSTSQIISLGVFAAGVILLVRIVKAASAARIHSQP